MWLTLGDGQFEVLSASDVHSDAETIEFRRSADDPMPAIAVTQIGEYGSTELRVFVAQDEDWQTVRAAVEYAKGRHGIEEL